MIQNIIVYIIGVTVTVYIAISIYRLITRRRNPCSNCAGCDLKNEYERKRLTCNTSKKDNDNCECNEYKP